MADTPPNTRKGGPRNWRSFEEREYVRSLGLQSEVRKLSGLPIVEEGK
jgi:hypothetical protein